MKKSVFYLLIFQGLYYVVSGLWPLLHMDSFLSVSAIAADPWLIKTISLLTVCVGLALFKGSSEKYNAQAIYVLGVVSASVFVLADVYIVKQGYASRPYLAGGMIINLVCSFMWCAVLIKRPVSYPRF